MEGKIVDWASHGQMISLKCVKCGAYFLTKNIGGKATEDGRVTYLARNLHVTTLAALECDAAGHTLADLRVDKE